MKFRLNTLCVIICISLFTISCGSDDEATMTDNTQMTDDDGMSALEVAREETVTTLTDGSDQTWRIGQAILTNENGSFDISDNFNIQDDEFIFTGDLANPRLIYRARNDINVDASSQEDALLDFYLSDEEYSFSFVEGSSTELISIDGMFTFNIGEDNTISGVLALPGRNQVGTIDLMLNIKQPGDYATPLSGTVLFSEAFSFESNQIASGAPGVIGSYSENSLYLVTREDGLENSDNIRPERIFKFNLDTGNQAENLFFQNDFVSKQLHIINNELIVIGGQFVNRYPLDFSTEPTSINHGLVITRHGMSVLDDNAYIIGGDLDLDSSDVEAEKIYSFNLNSNSLSFEADMPEDRFGARATIVNNKMYVFGGTELQFGPDALNSIYIVDLTTIRL